MEFIQELIAHMPTLIMLTCVIPQILGSVNFALKDTLTTALIHKTCINIFGQVLEKTLFTINAIFTNTDSQ